MLPQRVGSRSEMQKQVKAAKRQKAISSLARINMEMFDTATEMYAHGVSSENPEPCNASFQLSIWGSPVAVRSKSSHIGKSFAVKLRESPFRRGVKIGAGSSRWGIEVARWWAELSMS